MLSELAFFLLLLFVVNLCSFCRSTIFPSNKPIFPNPNPSSQLKPSSIPHETHNTSSSLIPNETHEPKPILLILTNPSIPNPKPYVESSSLQSRFANLPQSPNHFPIYPKPYANLLFLQPNLGLPAISMSVISVIHILCLRSVILRSVCRQFIFLVRWSRQSQMGLYQKIQVRWQP